MKMEPDLDFCNGFVVNFLWKWLKSKVLIFQEMHLKIVS
jgi:hypothetical protein